MAEDRRRRRQEQSLTIVRIYRPDPERQLKALQFLLEVKGPRTPTPLPEIRAPHSGEDPDAQVVEEAPAIPRPKDSAG